VFLLKYKIIFRGRLKLRIEGVIIRKLKVTKTNIGFGFFYKKKYILEFCLRKNLYLTSFEF
jgi:hypothetical protein